MLADVVRSAFGPDDAEFDELTDVDAATVRDLHTGAGHDAVIACVENCWDSDVVELKQAHPSLVVVGLPRDGRHAWLYLLLPHPWPLGELGPHELRTKVLDEVQLAAS